MKIQDLAIGDWVYDGKRTMFPMQVVGIFQTEGEKGTLYLNFEGNEGDVWEEDVVDIVPIPITGYILTNSGFRNEADRYCFSYTQHIIIFPTDGIWDLHLYVDGTVQLYRIEYLHQLQHILRLAGVEVEFKV